MAFILPFENEIHSLQAQLATLGEHDPIRAQVESRLESCERDLYPGLSAHDKFLLSGNPLRPKALDYIRHVFSDVRLYSNPDIRGDHLVVAGEAKIDVSVGSPGGRRKPIDVIVIGQQTGPSSQREDLLKLPVAEYQRWNQGMGFPDGYRKAVYFMDLAEKRGWPVVVLVDTPGADPSEYSEGEGQAFAINDVIHKTTSLKVPSLSYIISLGASGGAIALTATNRTIINEYATYMVISPGGCASILFRNRSPQSIYEAAEGLCLTSADAMRQGTVDEVVEEGSHPGHRYPQELLESGKDAIGRNLAEILNLGKGKAQRARREKFFAMGVWGECDDKRDTDALAKLAVQQEKAFADVQSTLAEFVVEHNGDDERSLNEEQLAAQLERRRMLARVIYAAERLDTQFLSEVLGSDVCTLSRTQLAQIREYLLERRYGDMGGARSLHPNGGVSPYRRQHPVDWIRWLTDADTFREFAETIRHCSIDQLDFPKYEDALARGIKDTGLHSGLITGTTKIAGYDAVLTINNFGLAGSSLCDEISEKYRFAAGRALAAKTPLVSIAMGGGARMQEGTPSMHRNIPKAQHALNELEEAGVPHVSVIADPTLGGTAISYGLRGDYMIVVEGSANIGFSGKRVVEQFQECKVASDFQHEVWLLRRGFVDECVATHTLGKRIAELLKHVADGGRLADLQTRKLRAWEPKQELVISSKSSPSVTVKPKSSKRSRDTLNVLL